MNTIYFVPKNGTPEVLTVSWVGSAHFTAGAYTFKYTSGCLMLGQHAAGVAYESKAMYEAARAAHDAWQRFRLAIADMKEPPRHLSATSIIDVQHNLFHAK